MQQSEEIEDLVQRYTAAIRQGDVDAISALIAEDDDVLFIGTDPREWWIGHDRVTSVFKEQFEAMGPGGIGLAEVDISAYAQGDGGWFAGRTAFQVPAGEVPVRFSGVASNRDGGWKLVHFHASIGVANEESVGQELPT